jgi:hypothetical protein
MDAEAQVEARSWTQSRSWNPDQGPRRMMRMKSA